METKYCCKRQVFERSDRDAKCIKTYIYIYIYIMYTLHIYIKLPRSCCLTPTTTRKPQTPVSEAWRKRVWCSINDRHPTFPPPQSSKEAPRLAAAHLVPVKDWGSKNVMAGTFTDFIVSMYQTGVAWLSPHSEWFTYSEWSRCWHLGFETGTRERYDVNQPNHWV